MVVWEFKGKVSAVRIIVTVICTQITFETEEVVELIAGVLEMRSGILGIYIQEITIVGRTCKGEIEIDLYLSGYLEYY